MTRTCESDGSWGNWGSCQDTCASNQICHNSQCVECVPASQETQTCPCGTEERTCDSNGSWGNWGNCNTICSAQYTCTSSRCSRTYTAFTNAGGPDCGKVWNGSSYTYYYCQAGDYCQSSTSKMCRKYELPQNGDIYHAYKTGTGPDCGKVWNGSSYTYYYCMPGDTCSSSTSKQCKVSGTACGDLYTAYKTAAGPECGKVWNGSSYDYYYCQPGDYCQSSTSKQCKIVTTCATGTYHAYKTAGGAQCGKVWNGSSYDYYYCQPLDTCQSATSRLCKK
jgi:hypothetical protein